MADAIAKKPFAYWLQHLQTMEGQWAPLQNLGRARRGPASQGQWLPRAASPTPTGTTVGWWPTRCSSTREPPPTRRAPLFAEHTDDILRELGRSDDEIIQLKDRRRLHLRLSSPRSRRRRELSRCRKARSALCEVICALSARRIRPSESLGQLLGHPGKLGVGVRIVRRPDDPVRAHQR